MHSEMCSFHFKSELIVTPKIFTLFDGGFFALPVWGLIFGGAHFWNFTVFSCRDLSPSSSSWGFIHADAMSLPYFFPYKSDGDARCLAYGGQLQNLVSLRVFGTKSHYIGPFTFLAF